MTKKTGQKTFLHISYSAAGNPPVIIPPIEGPVGDKVGGLEIPTDREGNVGKYYVPLIVIIFTCGAYFLYNKQNVPNTFFTLFRNLGGSGGGGPPYYGGPGGPGGPGGQAPGRGGTGLGPAGGNLGFGGVAGAGPGTGTGTGRVTSSSTSGVSYNRGRGGGADGGASSSAPGTATRQPQNYGPSGFSTTQTQSPLDSTPQRHSVFPNADFSHNPLSPFTQTSTRRRNTNNDNF